MKKYKVLVDTTVGELEYKAGQVYELSDEQVAAFAAGEVEVVADEPTPPAPSFTPASTPPAGNDTGAPVKGAEKKPWVGNHVVGGGTTNKNGSLRPPVK